METKTLVDRAVAVAKAFQGLRTCAPTGYMEVPVGFMAAQKVYQAACAAEGLPNIEVARSILRELAPAQYAELCPAS
jgi:hypothetical protein